MRVLFFGAGALGTLFAAKLCATGNDVSVLARGERLVALQQRGLRIRSRAKKAAAVETFEPKFVSCVATDEPWDLVVVLVRRPQVDDALRAIASEHDGDVLVMVNQACGYDPWRAILGARLFVGFGGAVAVFGAGDVLAYDIAPAAVQPTVVGEPDGRVTPRVLRAATALREAGFPVQVREDMEAWQLTHAAWIAPLALSAAIAARDVASLESSGYAAAWIEATQEALTAVRGSGTTLTPAAFRALRSAPAWLLERALRVALRSHRLREQLTSSGASSCEEGVALVDDLVGLAGRRLPALQALAARAAPTREEAR